MTRSTLLDEILQLPPEERLKLVEAVWDSLVKSSESVPVPDWHRHEIDRRLDHEHMDEKANVSWDDVQAQLKPKP
jgi:putative addiction module component (TIGR02574 family)